MQRILLTLTIGLFLSACSESPEELRAKELEDRAEIVDGINAHIRNPAIRGIGETQADIMRAEAEALRNQ